MADLRQYPWLSPKISLESIEKGREKSLRQCLDAISETNWSRWMKNTSVRYLLHSFEDGEAKPSGSALLQKKVSSWKSIASFGEFVRHQALQEKEQFTMSSLMAIVCETLVIYFLWAILQQKYLVNFSVDAVVGVLAAVFLFRNLQVKYRQLSLLDLNKRMAMLDVLAALLCFLLKLWVPSYFDLSLIVLVITYFIEKRDLKKELETSLESAGITPGS